MKKMGSINFYDGIDLNIKFDFEDLTTYLLEDTLLTNGVTDEDVVRDNFIDKQTGLLNMNFIENIVESYVNNKIKEKYGNDYSLDVMDDAMNLSWDVKVESIKQKHIETWWDKDQDKLKLPKLKKV